MILILKYPSSPTVVVKGKATKELHLPANQPIKINSFVEDDICYKIEFEDGFILPRLAKSYVSQIVEGKDYEGDPEVEEPKIENSVSEELERLEEEKQNHVKAEETAVGDVIQMAKEEEPKIEINTFNPVEEIVKENEDKESEQDKELEDKKEPAKKTTRKRGRKKAAKKATKKAAKRGRKPKNKTD